jgi:uncharacterized protein
MKKILGLLLAFCIATTGSLADAPLPLSAFPQSTLQIATPDARLHRFTVWIADNDRYRAQGLMFVKEMPADAGMLFLYPAPQRISMWMKNTLIPLDMIFIHADGRVSSVAANTTPMSEKIIESSEPVFAVLELKGGTAARLNIKRGAIVAHEAFKGTKAP